MSSRLLKRKRRRRRSSAAEDATGAVAAPASQATPLFLRRHQGRGNGGKSLQASPSAPIYLQRMCAACEEEFLQKKQDGGAKALADGGATARTIRSAAGGSRLPTGVQSRIEPVVGGSLDHVRVHDGPDAGRAASSIGARAFTHANHIYLGQGESANDVSLMAHESAHVMQQSRRGDSPPVQRRAADFRIRGRHPETASFPRIAFFGYSGSWLHPAERAKVDAMAMPADRDLELRGFASEEGDAAGNAALAQRRIDSVKSRLIARGHDPAHIAESPRPTEGANQIDYRRWRSVEIVATGTPATTPECATEPEFETPCPAARSTRIQTGVTRARNMIGETISRLGDPITYPHAQILLQRLFTGAPLADVISGLSTIRGHLATYSANLPLCATDCHSDCEGTLAYNDAEVTPNRMIVCPSFHTHADTDYTAVTLLHEASHAAPGIGTSDHAYEWDRLLDQLNSAESLDNADSYTMLVYLIFNPGARSIGPATPDTTNIADPGEQAQVEPAIARVAQWVSLTSSETQSLYSEIRDARSAGSWTNSWYESVMTHASSRFPLTAPPTVPVSSDQEKVAAIYDRYNRMNAAMGQVLDIRKLPGPLARWQAGPGVIVRVAPGFFGRPPVEQIEILLAALIRAMPDISTVYHVRYLQFTRDIRSMNSLGP